MYVRSIILLCGVYLFTTTPCLADDWIVFSASPLGTGPGNGEIWMIRPDGGYLVQVTWDGGNKGCPSVSPDGLRIAYTTERDALWVMDWDGKNKVQLCSNATADRTSWSPDGTRVAYVNDTICGEDIWIAGVTDGTCVPVVDSTVPTAYPATPYLDWSVTDRLLFAAISCSGPSCDQIPLYTIVPDGTGLDTLATTGDWASWSPDGSEIVLSRCGNIYRANVDGSGEIQLTATGLDWAPSWSPDGTRIAFNRDGDLWIMNAADGSGQQRLTTGFMDVQPSWAALSRNPDEWIVFSASPAPARFGGGNGEIWAIKPDGGPARLLTCDGGWKAGPSVSPGGTQIAYATVNDAVWIMNCDGTGKVALCNNATNGRTSWSPGGDRVAYVNDTACGEDIWMADVTAGQCVPAVDSSVPTAYPVTPWVDWSVNDRLVFSAFSCSGPACDEKPMYTSNPDGTGLDTLGTTGEWPSWSPDGT